MKAVADRVGVSVQTVSAVVNNKPGITQETRARVMHAVADLGYRPYSIARSLRTGQTHTLALVVSDLANPSFATMASAAEDYAHDFGYGLMVFNTHDDVEREANYIQTATQRWIDGALFVSAEDRMTSLDALEAVGIPFVAVDRIPEAYDGPSVTLDNLLAGRVAAQHLLGLGHRRLAHISGPTKLRLARERREGFCQELAAYGLDPAGCLQAAGDWTCDSGYDAMKSILSQQQPISAVFCANDRMAIGAMCAITEAGYRIPGEISVMGLDDIEVAAYQSPPLTTIRQSFADFATRAVRLLLDILAGAESADTRVVLAPVLIERASTAAPTP
jgi:DNA-binding LacI/PurR family transcriptional regulator